MNSLAGDYANKGVGSVFIYTGEAHPGENFPPLSSMEQKQAHAAALVTERGISRPVWLDALDGACHLAYGGLPNMCWIFNSAGAVLYKADWTGVESVNSALDYLLEVGERRKSGEKVVGFRVERFDFRRRDRDQFYGVLEQCGPQAVRDFADTFGPDWAS